MSHATPPLTKNLYLEGSLGGGAIQNLYFLLLEIDSRSMFLAGLPQTPHFIAAGAPQGADFKEKSLYKDEKYMDMCMNMYKGGALRAPPHTWGGRREALPPSYVCASPAHKFIYNVISMYL